MPELPEQHGEKVNIRTQVKAMKTATMVIIVAAVLIIIAVAVAGCGKTKYKAPAPSYKVSSYANIPGYETVTPTP